MFVLCVDIFVTIYSVDCHRQNLERRWWSVKDDDDNEEEKQRGMVLYASNQGIRL